MPLASVAQDYPSRPIQFIVPYTPATTADVLARLLGPRITQRWNQAVVVENKAGAGGLIGAESAAKAAPDGYTFLFVATSYGTLPAMTAKMPYDPVRSFTPVALLGTSAMTLVVNPQVPANNLREFIELAKKQPGKVNYASPGSGSSQQLAMELFKQEAGIHLVHIPYKGSAGAMNDLVGGHVQAGVVSLQTASNFVQAGKLRMLGVMSGERAASLPNVPTFREAGFPKMRVETWYGVLAPAGTPAPIVNKMNAELNELLQLPEIRDAMAKQGVDPAGGTPERMGTLLRDELKLWSDVVRRGKITAD
ncbi:MAG: tripartite tricarboxylate transporter substrate binding protein [Xanthobacteraceae bacterium]